MSDISRRQVLTGLAVLGIGATDLTWPPPVHAQAPVPDPSLLWPQPVTGISQAFPTHDAVVVRDLVSAAHSNLAIVKSLVSRQPALAKASWDAGFGDWETALGAASHVGNRPIAEFLLAHGAPPTIFSATMLGHLDVVRAMIAAQPDVQRLRGPHGIPLLSHARAGGATAAPVVTFLEALGGADVRVAVEPLSPEQRALVSGRYRFGPGPRDVFVIDEVREQLGIARVGASRRNVLHLGNLSFSPVGAEQVRINVVRAGDRVDGLTIADPDVLLSATREP